MAVDPTKPKFQPTPITTNAIANIQNLVPLKKMRSPTSMRKRPEKTVAGGPKKLIMKLVKREGMNMACRKVREGGRGCKDFATCFILTDQVYNHAYC